MNAVALAFRHTATLFTSQRKLWALFLVTVCVAAPAVFVMRRHVSAPIMRSPGRVAAERIDESRLLAEFDAEFPSHPYAATAALRLQHLSLQFVAQQPSETATAAQASN